jgi:hypothetical protein
MPTCKHTHTHTHTHTHYTGRCARWTPCTACCRRRLCCPRTSSTGRARSASMTGQHAPPSAPCSTSSPAQVCAGGGAPRACILPPPCHCRCCSGLLLLLARLPPPPHHTHTLAGYPAAYENALTAEGVHAAKAAAAAAAAAQSGTISPTAAAAAGVASAGGRAGAAAAAAPSEDAATTAFGRQAAHPRLPLLGGAPATAAGVMLCPGVPNSPALGVAGGLTHMVPAEVHLPQQHSALFRCACACAGAWWVPEPETWVLLQRRVQHARSLHAALPA